MISGVTTDAAASLRYRERLRSAVGTEVLGPDGSFVCRCGAGCRASVTRDDLLNTVARVFGWQRRQDVLLRIDAAADRLIADGVVVRENGFIRVPASGSAT